MKYEFFSMSPVSPEAQQGEALLWSSWLEKHPETDPGSGTAVWDDPDTKAAWDNHAAETYYSYWEQYSYWAAQGWTTDQSVYNGNTGEEAAAAGVMDEGVETHPEEWRDGQSGAESQRTEEVEAPCDDAEVLNDLFGQNCTLEACESAGTVSEGDGSDDPSDGGNDRKRPAASSSRQNTDEHTGNNCVCVCVYQYIINFGKYCFSIYHINLVNVFQTLCHIRFVVMEFNSIQRT